ncbi:MAG: hypothetical protein AAF149_12505 [Bacteroidota bacterium]
MRLGILTILIGMLAQCSDDQRTENYELSWSNKDREFLLTVLDSTLMNLLTADKRFEQRTVELEKGLNRLVNCPW